MLEEVGSYDAKTKLPEILRRVESDAISFNTILFESLADCQVESNGNAFAIGARWNF